MQNLHIPNSDKTVDFFSLDVILSVGYHVKSKRGVEFFKWANSVLKDTIVKVYAVNKRIAEAMFLNSAIRTEGCLLITLRLKKIADQTLAAFAIMIAESQPA